MKIQFAIPTTLFVSGFETPVPPTKSPADDDGGENEDPFYREREHPIDDATWAL